MAEANNPFNLEELQSILAEQLAKSEHLNDLPISVHKRLHLVEALQNKYDTLLSELDKEKMAIEAKYHAQFTDFYKQREAIVTGASEPSQELLKDYKPEGESKEQNDVKGIPKFWYHALMNCEHLDVILEVNPDDEEILAHLTNISFEYLPEGDMDVPDDDGKTSKIKTEGFKIIFTFEPNEFFKGTELTKTFILTREDLQLSLVKVLGTEIEWEPNCNPTKKLVKKNVASSRGRGRGRGRGGRGTKTVTVEQDVPSFFSFFKEVDEDDEDGFQRDFVAGSLIKDRLIPRAVDYYMGKVEVNDVYDEDEDEFDDEDEDEDEDEGIENSDDENDASQKEEKPTQVVENPQCQQQ